MRRPKPKPALERAAADLHNGRPDLARDRITGLLYTLHQKGQYQESAYSLLGDAYFTMRDLPRAGAAWLLTERDDADAHAAIAAFFKRYGQKPEAALQYVKPRVPSELYPPKVRERLAAWNYRYVPYRSRSNPHANSDTLADGQQSGLRAFEMGCLMVIVFGVLMVGYYLYAIFFGRAR